MSVIKVVHGNIVEQSVDCIVNAANTALRPGGGVCGAIYGAAGPELDEWMINNLGVGENLWDESDVVHTPSFNLAEKGIKGIIHTIGPVWDNGHYDEGRELYYAYYNSLHLASSSGYRSIAFPAISTGIYRFPIFLAELVERHAINDFLRDYPDSFDQILLMRYKAKPLRYLFLDFDGVLNSWEYSMNYFNNFFIDPKEGYNLAQHIDPKAVEKLNKILAASGAKVVISSSWRKEMTIEELQVLLDSRGFKGKVVDKTLAIHGDRGLEILSWMDDNNVEEDQIVILDDIDNMLHLKSRLVLTSGNERGLEDTDVAKALALWGL